MKLFFGGLIAVILLLLYTGTVLFAIYLLWNDRAAEFNTGYTFILTTVGGLVSALVIAELSITRPGTAPGQRFLAAAAGGAAPGAPAQRALIIVTALYLAVWVAAGLAALVFGMMIYPDKLQPLRDLGQAWLGLAVAAAYAYLGIQQPQA